jgi:hypothetical protein
LFVGDEMNAIKGGISQRTTQASHPASATTDRTARERAPFSRTGTPSAAGVSGRPSGPRATATGLLSRCEARRTALQAKGEKSVDFIGRDGDAAVFCNPERAEVCIQTGMDVCTVKSDGRVFLNGDPLERHEPGFRQMQRRLAEIGEKAASGVLDRSTAAVRSGAAVRSPWDAASPAHVNYVL